MENDKWHRDDALYFLKNNKHSIYFLIINLRSEADMKQLKRIKTTLNLNIHYGLNYYNNLIIWIYEADAVPYISPHSSQEFLCIFYVIDYLCNQIQNGLIDKRTEKLVLLINECWQELWNKERRFYTEKVSLSQFLKIRNERRTVALFGAGKLLRTFDREYFNIKEDNLYNIGLILDNNKELDGLEYANGVKIVCPIKHKIEWENLFIIVMTKNNLNDVTAQLQQNGLQYEIDYLVYSDIFEK